MPSVTLGTTTPVAIVATNPKRNSLVIYNNGSQKAYLCSSSNLTTATASMVIDAGGNFTEDASPKGMYLGPFYGIAASTTGVTIDIRYWERVI